MDHGCQRHCRVHEKEKLLTAAKAVEFRKSFEGEQPYKGEVSFPQMKLVINDGLNLMTTDIYTLLEND